LALALAPAVAAEDAPDLLPVGLAPGELLHQQLRERPLRVDGARVDVGQRRLAREALARLGVAELLADEVEQVGAVARVEHAQSRRQPQRLGVQAHEPPGDRVEGATDDLAVGGDAGALEQRSRPCQHLAGRAAGEGQKQDPLRREALRNQPRHSGGQRRRLAAPSSGQDQQRPVGRRGRGLSLLLVELAQPVVSVILCEHTFEHTGSSGRAWLSPE
jgi:hypothetical protein